ncbi:phytanoyl-CoA dioxygenase family protein [Erythrobacter litoralis]|uniref:phytanoyl-CoA dioxygenase family protein n=1 Tax=Erythrobacter litoralis TaxID=39960 RepID=UPI0024349A95|nr:phytanoyl-CoA dioxygenase family protein [Erythrobacter litoralis]
MRFADAVAETLPLLEKLSSRYNEVNAGTRIARDAALYDFVSPESDVGRLVCSFLPNARPVRAILFNKTAQNNWALGWHQDRTICVRERVDTGGFGPWSTKHGILHVEPPFEYIEGMITVRLHLDKVSAANAPLLVANGSHRIGKVAAGDIRSAIAKCPTTTCFAASGDVWLYSTPIIHASERSMIDHPRRVLQVDYSADRLPNGLEWTGIC